MFFKGGDFDVRFLQMQILLAKGDNSDGLLRKLGKNIPFSYLPQYILLQLHNIFNVLTWTPVISDVTSTVTHMVVLTADKPARCNILSLSTAEPLIYNSS